MKQQERIPLLPQSKHSTRPIVSKEKAYPRSTTRGITYIFLSSFCQSMFLLFSHISEMRYGFRAPSVLLIRAPTSVTLSLATLAIRSNLHKLRLPAPVLGLVVFRGLVGAICAYSIMVSVAYIAAGPAITILSIAPVLTSIVSAIVFRNDFTILHFVLLCLNFFGVALVLNPAPGTGSAQLTGSKDVVTGVTYALTAVLAQTGVFVLVKKIGHRAHPVVLSLSPGICSFAILPIVASISDVKAIFSNRSGALLAFLADVIGFIDMILLAIGLQDIGAGTAAVIRTLNVPITFALGYFLMGESVSRIGGVGAFFVVISIMSLSVMQLKEKHKE